MLKCISRYLSNVVKDDLNLYLKNLLSPIIKKIDKKYIFLKTFTFKIFRAFKEKCFDVLRTLEQNGVFFIYFFLLIIL